MPSIEDKIRISRGSEEDQGTDETGGEVGIQKYQNIEVLPAKSTRSYSYFNGLMVLKPYNIEYLKHSTPMFETFAQRNRSSIALGIYGPICFATSLTFAIVYLGIFSGHNDRPFHELPDLLNTRSDRRSGTSSRRRVRCSRFQVSKSGHLLRLYRESFNAIGLSFAYLLEDEVTYLIIYICGSENIEDGTPPPFMSSD
ncbi:hypothetical protein ABKN59_006879 [Abortiporus biennis]